VLRDAGYAVETAVDGATALAAIDGHDFAVVITDLRMPGADGLAVLRKLRVSACGRRFARGAQGLRIYRSGRRLGTECASPRARLAPGL
jgi:CheY-like chemotaxis protein